MALWGEIITKNANIIHVEMHIQGPRRNPIYIYIYTVHTYTYKHIYKKEHTTSSLFDHSK